MKSLSHTKKCYIYTIPGVFKYCQSWCVFLGPPDIIIMLHWFVPFSEEVHIKVDTDYTTERGRKMANEFLQQVRNVLLCERIISVSLHICYTLFIVIADLMWMWMIYLHQVPLMENCKLVNKY